MDGGAPEVQPSLSDKSEADENFPVSGGFLAPHLRPCVAAFYAFARAADDVADDPGLAADEKLRRLDLFEAALEGAPGPVVARRLAVALADRGVTDAHARDLLVAFRWDASVRRYPDWAALMGYCARSAAPVGRFLLDLHGEPREVWPASDALCAALQVLNHLQDLGEDRRRLDRVYLPLDWMAAEGAALSALDRPRTDPPLRRAIDRALDACDGLTAEAAALPPRLGSRRLAGQSAMIVALARRLSARLRRGDPLAARVRLRPTDFLRAAGAGALAALAPRPTSRKGPRP